MAQCILAQRYAKVPGKRRTLVSVKAGGNFKEPQPDLANGGMFKLGAPQHPSPQGADQ